MSADRVIDTVPARFARQCVQGPDRIAVEDEAGARLTYADLDRVSDRVAAGLRARGFAAEARIALILDRTVALPQAMLAVLKAGFAYVPIDLDTPRDRLDSILRRAKVAAVLTSTGIVRQIPQGNWDILDLAALGHGMHFVPESIPPNALAYVMHTSGTTGEPKGVMIEHKSITSFVEGASALYPLGHDDRFLLFSSTMFDVATFDVFAALLNGATLFVASTKTRQSPASFQELLRMHRITVYMGTPGILEFLDPDKLPDLRTMPVGGEIVAADVVNRWQKGRIFLNSYGPTETTVAVVAHRCIGEYRFSPPIGRAMPFHRAYVLDENFRPVAAGTIGELCIGGPGVGRGYFAMPKETAAAFVPDPLSPRTGQRMYRTGDFVRELPNGEIQFLRRRDRQVKIRGHRVELDEIELTLRSLDAVTQAVVAVIDGPNGHKSIHAWVVASAGLAENWRDEIASRLPHYMVPAEVHQVEAIPLKQVGGKTDLEALRAMLDQNRSIVGKPSAGQDRSGILSRLMEDVIVPILGHERFTYDDDLLNLGFDSIQIIRLCSAIERTFEIEIDPEEFFDHPSPSELARHIEARIQAHRQ